MITNLDKFAEIINEGFAIDFTTNTVYFDPRSDLLISTSFGKYAAHKPYEMKTKQGKILSVYKKSNLETSKQKEQYKEVLAALKGQSNKLRIDRKSYDQFLNRTAIYFRKFISEYEIDTILSMSSSSSFVNDMMQKLQSKLPSYYTLMSFENAINKNPNFDEIGVRGKEFNLQQSTIDSLKDEIQKMANSGTFKIHNFHPPHRKIIKNWLKLNDDILSKVIDKNIILLDDYLTTGSTLIEASNLLEEMGANYVLGITVIKGT